MSTTNRMTDPMTNSAFGRAALKKMGSVPDNFLIYRAEWLGKDHENWKEMAVTGGEFVAPTRGKHAGQLVKLVTGTHRRVIVTKAEIAAELAASKGDDTRSETSAAKAS